MRVHLLGVCVYNEKTIGYISNPTTETTKAMTAIEVVRKYVENYFSPLTILPKKSLDRAMPWTKQFTTSKKMIDKALAHAIFENDDVPMCCLGMTGDFTCVPLRWYIEYCYNNGKYKGPSWIFTRDPKAENEIQYNPNSVTFDDSSYNNMFFNYGRSIRVFDSIKGTSQMVEYKGRPLLSAASILPRTNEIKVLPGTSQHRTDNVHPEWEMAEMRNQTEWQSLSSVKTILTVSGGYYPLSGGDLVSVREKDVGQNISMTDKDTSGDKIVSKVCYIISQRQLNMYVELIAESNNDPEGDFFNPGGVDGIKRKMEVELQGLVTPANDALTKINDTIGSFTSGISSMVKAPVNDLLASLSLPSDLPVSLSDIQDKVGDVIDNVQSAIGISSLGAIKDMTDKCSGLVNNFISSANGIINSSINELNSYIGEAVGNMVGDTAATLLPTISLPSVNTPQINLDTAENLLVNATREIVHHKENVTGFIGAEHNILDIPKSVVKGVLEEASDSLVSYANRGVSQLSNGVLNEVSKVANNIASNVISDIKNGVSDALSGMGIPEGVVSTITNAVGGGVGNMLASATSAMQIQVGSILGDITGSVQDTIGGCVNSLTSPGNFGPLDMLRRFAVDKLPGVMSPWED
jgi:hypothetical protein